MLNYTLNEDQVKISDDKFIGLINDDLQEIINELMANGFNVRIVGGAVRDILSGELPRDVDIITDALPDEIIFILSELDIEADAYSIVHGTIKAIIKKVKYEITSLNYQMHKDAAGKIQIISGGSWEEDAQRRDFTVNAMSMDLDGTVYDYLNGLDDLKATLIRPIPDFDKKIKNDPVLILRFFKMLAKWQGVKYPKSALNTVIDNLNSITKVDNKRIKRELANIRKSANGKQTIKLMKDIGLMDILNSTLKLKTR